MTLAILALQAATAEDNQRLLEQERERAAMRAELRDARVSLERRGRQLQELITRQEEERSAVAHELHEHAAQMLAGVLLGVRALERELGSELAAPTLGALRSGVQLHAPVAAHARGQPPAAGARAGAARRARGLGRRSAGRAWRGHDGRARRRGGTGADTETMIYRVVEEALDAVGGGCAVRVHTPADRRRARIVVDGGSRSVDGERLTLLSARLELMCGALSVTEDGLRAFIPLPGGDREPLAAGASLAAPDRDASDVPPVHARSTRPARPAGETGARTDPAEAPIGSP